ncbi:FERM, ARHGEF and pleckstrin domain-containing protein 1-like [Macrosteles quadrilineatus]|uniref:FERM, ARHGEF and pleckstrin domain-containing protein 1-like n=1 Tax=Macrosteles quadrilineatus TaxID=74068 RepID=UPI0023E181CE|nr:FERM, ARHGEF and pleckstrin domain-containing protein 1-like [Macrosteles quadrilineatus]XP_054290626.1 FERM, ARHGEF and pleckstrin domain-containing protein 1-like [Macrosteles quadrilineatus]
MAMMNDSSLSHSRASSCSKLPHSHSTPVGVDGGVVGCSRTPPTTPKKGGKMLAIRVQMLDDSVTMFQVQAKAVGRVLFDQVCKQLHLLEADYFGLEYQDPTGTRYWLDLEKPLARQVGLTLVDPLLQFCVKFYTPDPAQLEEEFTRYLFCLQIKRDLAQGHIQCNENTAALMASYIVQAECGDFVAEDYPDPSYLSTYKFVPHQDRDLERRIMENHKKHAGQSPAEADLNLLETARRCELYGMKMHAAKDHEGVPLNLSVAHMGLVVFQNYTKINTFSWAKIRKISFKRKRFLIKLHPEGYGYYKDTVEFFFEGRNECKNFWKKCVENHGFFRCSSVKKVPRQRTRVLSRGSSFRYSGKTQKQIVEFVRENYVKRQTFQRSQSFRHSSSVHSSVATNVGGSISAHPLLPLGDSSIVSLSCGSMSLAGVGPAGSQSPIVRRQQQTTNQQTTTAIAERTAIDSRATFTPEPPGSVISVGSGDERSSPAPPVVTQVITHNVRENNNIVSSTPTHKTNGTLNNYNEVSLTPDLSPLKSIKDELNKGSGDLVDGEVKKKRNTSDKAYFIAKEILMTERTYRKDLEVINLWWRDEVCKEECPSCVDTLLNLLDPLHDAHCLILRDVELRLASWETRNSQQQRISDILLRSCDYLPLYENYIDRHLEVLEQLDVEFRTNPKFEQVYRDFESQKICYLPLTAFVLKPLHRIFHYTNLLDRLLKHYTKDHIDYEDCLSARDRLRELQPHLSERLRVSENFVALCELQRDTVGFDHLTSPHRQFLRQGCLNKFSTRKGYLQRMFFLFSDVLLYTNRVGHMFSVHGQLPLHTLAIEERCDTPTANSFIIYGGNRVLTLAASSEEEKDKWLEDLTEAMDYSKNLPNDEKISYLSLKSCSSSDDVMDKCGTEDHRVSPQRSNTTVHVCWHRNTSLSMEDILRAAHNTLSGYLLRKFKNSNGWQKLWVVFTNFCLFFYKTFQDDCPLASLPLLGYTVSPPSDKDAIHKDFVFKLQFKNHVYFFRAESEYTFGRWMEVISSATQHAGRTRLFSRKDSALED